MKTSLKKYLSVLLAVVFVLTMIPVSSMVASAAASEITLEDGTTWLAELGSDATFTSDGTGGYILDAKAYKTATSSFKLMQNKAYPVLTTDFNLGIALGPATPAKSTFGLSKDYNLDNAGIGNSYEGRFEIISQFEGLSASQGNQGYKFYMMLDGVKTEVGVKGSTPRQSIAKRNIVEKNGSYYMTFKGYVIDGTGYSEKVQEAVKLENYFPVDFLKNNGMLYFFFTGESQRSSGSYYKPTPVVSDLSDNAGATINSSIDKYNTASDGLTTLVSNGAAPTANWLTGDANLYQVQFGKAEGSIVLTRPMTAYADGTYSNFKIGNATYTTDGSTSVSTLTADSKLYIDFSNDPYFSANSYNSIKITRTANNTSKAELGTEDSDFSGVYFPAYNLVSQLAGATYNYGFAVNESNQVILSIKSGSYGGVVKALPRLTAGKPIYIRLRKTADNYHLRINVKPYDTNQAEINNINGYIAQADVLENPLDAQQQVADYLASSCKAAVSYSKQLAASRVMYKYYTAVEEAAAEFEARIDAIPDTDKLVYADAEKINALKAEFDALNSDVKAKIKNLDKLTNAIANIPAEYDGRFRTEDGTMWNVDYDSDYVTVSSSESGSLLMEANSDGKNTLKSYVYAITEDTFPILSGTYHMSLNYGATDNAAFGLTAYGNMDSIHDVPFNNFTILRRHNPNDTVTFYLMIKGERYECGTKGSIDENGKLSDGTVRARVFTAGVVEQNGYHYMKVDGVVLDGAGYDANVQEALKLENHFGADFIENNGMVHFFTSVDSLGGNISFARPTTRLLDGTMAYAADTFSELNGGYSGKVSSYNSNNSKTTYKDGTTTYNFTVAKNGYAILTAPVNKDGFSVKGYMEPNDSSVQWITFYFSNDPTFKDGTEKALQLQQQKGKTSVLVCVNGTHKANSNNLFNRTAYTFSIGDKDANGTYTVYVGGSNSTLDVTSLIGKPIYVRVNADANGSPDMVITNADSSVDKADELANAFPAEDASAEEIETALDAFYASEYRFSSYDNAVKATELGLLANVKKAESVTTEIDEISKDTDYFAQKDRIDALTDTISVSSVAVRGGITNYKKYIVITNYINALDYSFNAESLSDIRKLILGKDAEKTYTAYDYNNNSAMDLQDLVRAKKQSVEKVETYSNSNYEIATLSAEDFGLVGDGETDDTIALANAVKALASSGNGSILTLGENKTYYIADAQNYAIYLNDVEGLTIDGNGSTILLGESAEYIRVTDTADCKIENLHLDYKTKPAFTAKTVEVNAEEGWAIMSADRDIGLADGEVYPLDDSKFGVIKETATRLHMRMTKYEKISGNLMQEIIYDNLFKIYFNTNDAATMSRITAGSSGKSTLQASGMICPMPKVGYSQERAASIMENNGFSMENVYFHSAAKFGIYIARNDEKDINLTNVSFVPAENNLDKNMNFTSWRDAFHCKDNRCAINWDNCTATGNYDDIFNVSTTGLYLSSVNSTGKVISVVWNEAGSKPEIKAGDTLSVINSATGDDYGTVTVKSVLSKKDLTLELVLEEALDSSVQTGIKVLAYFTNLAAPNSTITNCDFSGTYRFRGDITISDTEIYNQRMWIDTYSNIEGPVPKNITFKNCTITSGLGASIIIGVNSPKADGYHVENIVFENCKLDSETLEIYDNDKQYVSLIGCTENDGTPIPDTK